MGKAGNIVNDLNRQSFLAIINYTLESLGAGGPLKKSESACSHIASRSFSEGWLTLSLFFSGLTLTLTLNEGVGTSHCFSFPALSHILP